jgi:hypothetical protein
MYNITFRGTGQLNGVVIINKTIEVDDRTATSLTGLKSDEVKDAILAIHYPGVKIDPSKISTQSNYVNTKKVTKQSSNTKKAKFDFTFSNIILWILFFPFKLIWWIVKDIFKKDRWD